MAIIDEKGRLFGKVNLLDLVVVLAVLALVARFGYQRMGGGQAAAGGESKPIEIVVKLPAVEKFTVDAIKPGASWFDSKSNSYMGTVVEVKSQPAVMVTEGAEGRQEERPSTTKLDVFVTVKGQAYVSDNAVMMGGIEVKVGRVSNYATPRWAGGGPVVIINENPAAR